MSTYSFLYSLGCSSHPSPITYPSIFLPIHSLLGLYLPLVFVNCFDWSIQIRHSSPSVFLTQVSTHSSSILALLYLEYTSYPVINLMFHMQPSPFIPTLYCVLSQLYCSSHFCFSSLTLSLPNLLESSSNPLPLNLTCSPSPSAPSLPFSLPYYSVVQPLTSYTFCHKA